MHFTQKSHCLCTVHNMCFILGPAITQGHGDQAHGFIERRHICTNGHGILVATDTTSTNKLLICKKALQMLF